MIYLKSPHFTPVYLFQMTSMCCSFQSKSLSAGSWATAESIQLRIKNLREAIYDKWSGLKVRRDIMFIAKNVKRKHWHFQFAEMCPVIDHTGGGCEMACVAYIRGNLVAPIHLLQLMIQFHSPEWWACIRQSQGVWYLSKTSKALDTLLSWLIRPQLEGYHICVMSSNFLD